MPKTKVAVSLDVALVKAVDAQVKRKQFPSRSAAIEAALRELNRRQTKAKDDAEYERLLAMLDPDEERALAEERYTADVF